MPDATRPGPTPGADDAAYDRAGQDVVEGRKPKEAGQPAEAPPAASPATHSDVATPGSGALPSGDHQGDVDPATD